MKTINTSEIIPVDLNCILYKYEKNLEFMFSLLEEKEKTKYYSNQAELRKIAIQKFLWNEEAMQWYDYNFVIKEHTKIESISNYFPLWAECYMYQNQVNQAIQSLESGNLLQKSGVVSTSLYTRQQWDFPNGKIILLFFSLFYFKIIIGWPPLQWFLIEGLRNSKIDRGFILAKEISVSWLCSNLAGFDYSYGQMYEKYDTRFFGYRGFGIFKFQANII